MSDQEAFSQEETPERRAYFDQLQMKTQLALNQILVQAAARGHELEVHIGDIAAEIGVMSAAVLFGLICNGRKEPLTAKEIELFAKLETLLLTGFRWQVNALKNPAAFDVHIVPEVKH